MNVYRDIISDVHSSSFNAVYFKVSAMVKVKIISRSKLEWTKDRTGEIPRAHRNYDPLQNTFIRPTEYVRALRAVKLEQMFAQPFIAGMHGHHDTITSISCDPTNISKIATSAYDGEVCVWNCLTHKLTKSWPAHRNVINGCCFTPDGVALVTASLDKLIKIWDTDFTINTDEYQGVNSGGINGSQTTPITEYQSEHMLTDVDYHWVNNWFVTAGSSLNIWDINRASPIQTFAWGDEAVLKCAFNKIEANLVACCFADRGVAIYDARSKAAHSKLIMESRITSLRWNPMDPNVFVGGCDDWNCYLYDLRMPHRAKSVLQGPVHAVTTVDFAPTGRHIAAGSTDCTVSLWDIHTVDKSRATEIFHTKRMAKVFAVQFSLDSRFIFSGSEDAIARIWKTDRAAPIRSLRGAEKHTYNYLNKVKERYSHIEEVKRIKNQRNTPKAIRKRSFKKRRIMQRKLVAEMARKCSDNLKPLAVKKTVQSLE